MGNSIPIFKSIKLHVGILLILVVLGVLYFTTCHHKSSPQPPVTDSVAYWKDKYGNEHAKVVQLSLEKGQLTDSIAKVLKIKPKQITKYVKAGIRIDTVVKSTVTILTKTDTVSGKVDTFYSMNYVHEPYIHIKATESVPGSGNGEIEIGVNANIVVTDYWKRKHKILGISYGEKRKYTDIGTDNPYIQITNATSVSIEKKKWRVAPGVGIGLNYDPFSKTIHPGIQLGFYLTHSR